MTDQELDRLLSQAAPMARDLWLSSLPGDGELPQARPSPAFQRRMDRLIRRMQDQEKQLILDPEVISFLIDKGYQPEYGARPLRRAVERYLEDALAEDILRGVFKEAPVIHVKADNQKLLFFPEAKEEEKKETVPPKRKTRKKKEEKE